MTASKEQLFKPRTTEAEVDVPGIGAVRVRALTRAEGLAVRDQELPLDEVERKVLALAMVDPALTEDDVAEWQRVSPAGELEPVMKAILKLSGMEADADRAAMQRFRR